MGFTPSWAGTPDPHDSGGYQVFSLAETRRISEEGVEFASVYDGSRHVFAPELTTRVQEDLGSEWQWSWTSAPAKRGPRYHEDWLSGRHGGRRGARSAREARTRRSSVSCREVCFPTCGRRVSGSRSGSGSTATLWVAFRLGVEGGVLRTLALTAPSLPPANRGTSWELVTLSASCRSLRSGSTCSTACSLRASPATAPP